MLHFSSNFCIVLLSKQSSKGDHGDRKRADILESLPAVRLRSYELTESPAALSSLSPPFTGKEPRLRGLTE